LIESAQVIGLALLPARKYHPFELDTFGLGAVLKTVSALEPKRCLLGIGGSATNDGGFGLARALGWRFLNKQGAELLHWSELIELQTIQTPQPLLMPFEIVVGVDVQNPLLGPVGATRVYGPQKGLRAEDFDPAEACLSRMAEVAERVLGLETRSVPGTGAAGGLGFGLLTFLRARLESGFAIFAEYAQLEERIRACDLVLTGEGCIDQSTLMGKGVGELARLCQKHGVPCVGLAGQVGAELTNTSSQSVFRKVYGIVPTVATAEVAKEQAAECLKRLGRAVARNHAA
jgi:glycerate kinase